MFSMISQLSLLVNRGNFNIIVFGQNSNEATMIIINHWNAHIWAVSCGTDLGTWKWMQLYK